MNEYTAQNTIRLGLSVQQVAGAVGVDPTAVTLSMRLPDGTVSDLSTGIVRDSAGAYHCDFAASVLGLHMYEWKGTGSAVVAGIGQFLVSRSPW